ncbi:hypothetical protein GCM10022382_12460 [Microbacterium invictum]
MNTSLVIAFVAMTTVVTAIYLGLGFLPRPSRVAGIWSVGFIGGMVSVYLWAGGDSLDSDVLRAVSSGTMISMVALFWVGLRVRRGASAWHWIAAVAFLVVAPLTLAVFAETEHYVTAVRAVFVLAGIFTTLTVLELVRLGMPQRDEILPFALVSAAFGILSVVNVLQEAVRLIEGQPQTPALSDTRELNMIGSLLYMTCALVSLLLLTRARAPRGVSPAGRGSFAEVAGDRLRRAEATDDRWWSLLVIRLDDPSALREASSTHGFDLIAAKFAQIVRSTLPAEADIWARDQIEFVVLLPRPEGAVRQELVRVLREIAAADPESPLTVRLSASVGWAAVDAVGYDLDVLIATASDAADRAGARGGDRWERVAAVEAAR